MRATLLAACLLASLPTQALSQSGIGLLEFGRAGLAPMISEQEHRKAEREGRIANHPDVPRREAMAKLEEAFRSSCPRLPKGPLKRNVRLGMFQWAAIERPDLAVGYYESLRVSAIRACGAQEKSAKSCLRRYEDLADDFHKGYVVQPAFQAWNAERRVRVGQALAADAELLEARKLWATLDVEARYRIVVRVIGLVAAGYAGGGFEVPAPNIVRGSWKDGARFTQLAHYRARTQDITVNPRFLAGVTFERAFSIAQHETTHHIQRVLAQMLSDGGDGLAYLRRNGLDAEAAFFRANLGTELYLEEDGRSKRKFDRYERNIVERHANLYEWDVLSLRDDGSTDIAKDVAEDLQSVEASLERVARARDGFCKPEAPVASSRP